MSDEPVPALGGKSFEDMRRTNEHGAEYWSARDIQPLLGYGQWRRFESAIKKAITSCEQSGNIREHHFASAGKMVSIGSGSERKVSDYHLSRFACYLIAQNGDPRKPEIAHAQRYFAVQARRQELSDEHAADVERLELRRQAAEEFKNLVHPEIACANSTLTQVVVYSRAADFTPRGHTSSHGSPGSSA